MEPERKMGRAHLPSKQLFNPRHPSAHQELIPEQHWVQLKNRLENFGLRSQLGRLYLLGEERKCSSFCFTNVTLDVQQFGGRSHHLDLKDRSWIGRVITS